VNRKILLIVLAFALVMVSSAFAPVLAYGPIRAFEVGHNPNIQAGIPAPVGMVQLDAADNTVIWVAIDGLILHDVNAGTGQGRMNNAIIVDMTVLADIQVHPESYYNKWIYLSPEDGTPNSGGHGMLYYFVIATWGPGMLSEVLGKHPDGLFLMRHSVG